MQAQNNGSNAIWLLSPYHAGSHAAWAQGYKNHSQNRVDLLTMPGRFWKWRMQGGAVELAQQIYRRLLVGEQPDVLVATDMVNLSSLLGLLRSQMTTGLHEVPVLLYMHENQLSYPWPPGEKRDFTYAILNWTSQLCADCVIFNSLFHLDSWFDELPKLLKHFPDYNHLSLISQVREKSVVLPVGVECSRILDRADAADPYVPDHQDAEPPLILWNQRWEYDKRPDRFFRLLYRLRDAGIPFRLAVAGKNFRNVPQEFEKARSQLADRIIHWGYVETYGAYVSLMRKAKLVVSTAVHEFFGISILEAIVAGAFPLLPRRLSYPELIPDALHPACLYESEDDLFHKAKQRLLTPRSVPPSLQQHVLHNFAWERVAAAYDQQMRLLIDRGK